MQIISKIKPNCKPGYVNYLYNFGEKLEVNIGVRIENSDRTIHSIRSNYKWPLQKHHW
jgi:hypothetical protein